MTLLTTTEAASYLRVKERKLYELVSSSAIPCTKITGRWLFPKDELDRWLDVYGRAWENKDIDAFVDCFSPDALYYWGPWGDPLQGQDGIRAATVEQISAVPGMTKKSAEELKGML